MKPILYPPPSFKFNIEDNKRIIYICGPHGVGKSTLMKDLAFYNIERIREQLTHYDALQENVTRQIWRAALHCVEHRENLNYAQSQPPNSVVIGDRCFIDDMCYMRAFVKIGWLTEKERKNMFSLEDDVYKKSETPKPVRFIFLIPPLDWNIARITERWNNNEPAKWCEHNFGYLQVVRNEFENCAQYLTKKKQVKVIRETDRKQRINKVKEWINENDLEDFIVEGTVFVESPVGTGS
jgi:thymidylate kinase